MDREYAHFQNQEPLLERTLRNLRLKKIVRHIAANSRVIDLGCGYDHYFLRSITPHLQSAVAMDLSVQPSTDPKIRAMAHDLNTTLPLTSDYFDAAVSMANLEHLSNPKGLLKEAYRILKPGGVLILTTPSIYAKPVLEFLAYRLHIISEPEIRDHKMYFNRAILRDYLQQAGFKTITHRYFQLYMNNFILATK